VLEEALELTRQQGQSGAVLAALINLQTVAHWRGAFDRAVERATEALDLSVRLQDRPSAIYVQIRLASAAVEQADYSRAEHLAYDALDGARDLALPREESLALLVAGRAARGRGQIARSVDIMQRSADLATAIGHAVTATISWALLGVARQDMADDLAATTCCETALALAQESGTWLRLVAHVSRGQIALAQADWSRAQAEFQTALGIGRECESTWGQPTCLEGLAALALEDNDAPRAAHLLGAAASVRDVQGASVPEPERPRHEQLVSRVREALEPPVFERAWAEGQNCSLARW
jgi:tetratricopeptide (TPR) repeat protein